MRHKMPSLRESLQLLLAALAAYRFRPFDNLTHADIEALLGD